VRLSVPAARWSLPNSAADAVSGPTTKLLRYGDKPSLRLPPDTKIDDVWNYLKYSEYGSRKVIAYAQTVRRCGKDGRGNEP
jgi:hypothetical protein